MFYSQFILAKKGPLGTIWIAAHLERKLRKNQVADTDIGVSVDSILFPEVPIALRLSSHLLLGVVRIYSRKVNYLFNDCSEALLKIKQAFRSTAVDLPPEESTAPYHSITLPETFDLDDFELPDNVSIHANFDHHVSTREQITLQDTVEDVGYLTSQFGLDERFGDGDSSQIVLDFDEDLFSSKTRSPVHTSILLGPEADEDPQASGQPSTSANNMDIDEYPNTSIVDRSSEHMPELIAGSCVNHIELNTQDPARADGFSVLPGDHVQTPDLNDVVFPCTPFQGTSADLDMMDIACPSVHGPSTDINEECSPFATAQAPSTPGLMEEAIPASVQGVPALSHLKKPSVSSPVEAPVPGVPCNSLLDPDIQILTHSAVNENLRNPIDEQDLRIANTCEPVDSSLNEKISDFSTDFQPIPGGNMELDRVLPVDNIDSQASEIQDLVGSARDSSLLELRNVEPKDCSVAQHFEVLSPAGPDGNACPHIHVLQPCSTTMKQSTLLTPQDGLTEGNAMDCSVAQQFEVLNPVGLDGNACPRIHVLQTCSTTLKQSTLLIPQDGHTEGNAMDCSVAKHFEVLNPVGLDGNANIHVLQPCSTTPKQSTLLTPQDGLTEGNATDCSVAQHFEVLNPVGLDGNACQPSSTMLKQSTLLTPQDGLTEGNVMDCSVAQHFEILNPVGLDGNACPPIHVLQPCSTTLKQSTLLTPQDRLTEGNATDCSVAQHFKVLNSVGLDGNACQLSSTMLKQSTLLTPQDGLTEGNATDCSVAQHFEVLNPVGLDGNACPRIHVLQPCSTTLKQSTLLTPQDGLTEGNALDLPSREGGFCTLEVPGTVGPQDGLTERNTSDLPREVGFCTLEAAGTEGPQDGLTEGNALDLPSREMAFCSSEAPGTEGPLECGGVPVGEVGFCTLEAPGTEGPQDGLTEGNVPDFPSREVGLYALEVPETEGPLECGGQPMSVKLQGEGHPTEVTEVTLISQQKLEPVRPHTLDVHNKIYECLDAVFSSNAETGALPPPETLLLTPTVGPDLPDDLVMKQSGVEKEASVYFEQSIDIGKNISGKKRSLMESTPVLQNGNPSKFSGLLHSKRSADFVPDDDDILASILVGRRTPVFNLRPTPPPEVISLKRRRMTTKLSVHKRKVLLDETMILHSDAIRAQLTNTEDIRRVRRKAPCNPPEIWLIKKYSLEDRFLEEPLLTGMSSELADLYSQTWGITGIEVAHIGGSNTLFELSKELEFRRGVEHMKETSLNGVGGLFGRIPETENVQIQEFTDTFIRIQNDGSKNPVVSLAGHDTSKNPVVSLTGHTQETVDILTDTTLSDPSEIGKQVKLVSAEIIMDSNKDGNLTSHATGIESEVPNFTPPENYSNGSSAFRIESSPTARAEGMPECVVRSLFCSDQNLGLQTLGVVEVPTDETLLLTESTPLDASSDKVESKAVNNETSVLSDSTLKFHEASHLGGQVSTNDEIVVPVPGNLSFETGRDGALKFHEESHLEGQVSTNDEIVVPVPGNFSLETGADVLADSSGSHVNLNPNLNLTVESRPQTDLAIVYNDPVIGGTGSESKVVAEVGILNTNLNDEMVINVPGNFSLETGADVLVDSSGPQGNLNPNLNLTVESMRKIDLAIVHDDPVIGGTGSESKVVAGVGILDPNLNDEIVIPVPGNFSLETGADVVVDSSGPQGNLNPNLNLTVESMQKIDLAVVHDDPAIGGTGSESKIVAEVGILNPNLDDKIAITVPGNFSLETGADVVVDSSGPQGNLNPNLNLTMESLQKLDLSIVHDDPVIGGTRSEPKVVAKVGILAENVRVDQHALDPEGNPSIDSICTNEPVLASSLELNADSGSIPKYDLGENPGHQEVNLEVAEDGENTGMDIDTVNDSSVDHLQDYGHTSDGNNTEFLNMDDEVEHEEDADNITSEEARFLENSGWSSRTRAVARYLQCLFDNKDVPGSQRILHMDRLLVGKSRKEASRMFFETLVLKTREYIHVEQENPFANIHIHPTQKLTKSEF